MKFREHRGRLEDSMATSVEIGDRQHLIDHITSLHACFLHNYDFSRIEVAPYLMEPDDRIGWKETYIVTLPGYGVLGFTDSWDEPGQQA